MARRVRTSWRKMKKRHPRVYATLAESKGMTSNRMLNRFKKRKIKPIITLKKLRHMASIVSKRHGVPIKVTKDMTEGHRYADGVSIRDKSGDIHIRVHPVLKYYDKRYAKDVIEHESDHARVDKRVVRNYYKRHRG